LHPAAAQNTARAQNLAGADARSRAAAAHAMRFRAVLDRDSFKTVYAQAQLLGEAASKAVVLWLSREVVRLSAAADDDALQCFATLSTPALFADFKIEARTGPDVIVLELALANLLRGLRDEGLLSPTVADQAVQAAGGL
jgi:hypothetical protein